MSVFCSNSLPKHTSDVPPKTTSPSQLMASWPHLLGSQHQSHPQIHSLPPSPLMALWALWSQHSLETHNLYSTTFFPTTIDFSWHHSVSQPRWFPQVQLMLPLSPFSTGSRVILLKQPSNHDHLLKILPWLPHSILQPVGPYSNRPYIPLPPHWSFISSSKC